MDQPENFIPLPPDFRLMEEAGNVDLSYIDEEEEKEVLRNEVVCYPIEYLLEGKYSRK